MSLRSNKKIMQTCGLPCRAIVPAFMGIGVIVIERRLPPPAESATLALLGLGVGMAMWEGTAVGSPFASMACMSSAACHTAVLYFAGKVQTHAPDRQLNAPQRFGRRRRLLQLMTNRILRGVATTDTAHDDEPPGDKQLRSQCLAWTRFSADVLCLQMQLFGDAMPAAEAAFSLLGSALACLLPLFYVKEVSHGSL